jgi:hypothetical protein
MNPGAYVGASLGLNNIGPTKLPLRNVSNTTKTQLARLTKTVSCKQTRRCDRSLGVSCRIRDL